MALGLRALARELASLGAIGVLLALTPLAARAADRLPEGRRAIALVDAGGARLVIGHVTFAADGAESTFEINLDSADLRDEFLSMRPFRCLPDAKEMWCHLPYPYPSRRRVTGNDLVDLEYALLFLFKPPSAYGIDAWNGLYFKLSQGPGGVISGPVHEVDLNVLATPPDDPAARPIGHAALTPVAAGSHRFSALVIGE